jgi:hypothetical protein
MKERFTATEFNRGIYEMAHSFQRLPNETKRRMHCRLKQATSDQR